MKPPIGRKLSQGALPVHPERACRIVLFACSSVFMIFPMLSKCVLRDRPHFHILCGNFRPCLLLVEVISEALLISVNSLPIFLNQADVEGDVLDRRWLPLYEVAEAFLVRGLLYRRTCLDFSSEDLLRHTPSRQDVLLGSGYLVFHVVPSLAGLSARMDSLPKLRCMAVVRALWTV